MGKQHHGKALSECCQAPLKKYQNGEWQEFYCTKCKQFTDEDGALPHYLPKDYRGPTLR